MESDDTSAGWTIFGSVGAALGAAVCCLGPVVLVSLGVGGAWVGHLSALEPYRPLFMAVAAGFLGFGFYRVYRRPKQSQCRDGAECEVPRASLTNRVALWVATVAVVGLFASPYLLSLGVDETAAKATSTEASSGSADQGPDGQGAVSERRTVTLQVEGMTCAGCIRTIESALRDTEGVEEVQVTLEPPRANITYDASAVSVDELTEATGDAGFPSEPERGPESSSE